MPASAKLHSETFFGSPGISPGLSAGGGFLPGSRPVFRSATVSPETADFSSARTSREESAYSSWCLINNQFFSVFCIRTSVQEPLSFSPRKVTEIFPEANPWRIIFSAASRSPKCSSPSKSENKCRGPR